MTSFAAAFSPSDHSTKEQSENYEGFDHFAHVDLDASPFSNPQSHSASSNNRNSTSPLRDDPQSSGEIIWNNSSADSLAATSPENSTRKSFSSSSSMNRTSSFLDRRISIPDMSKLSSSSAAMVASMGPTIDKLKQWSRTRYKCTKQSIFEKLGKTSRTVDVELDAQIEQLRETKRRYETMLALARSYANHFANLMSTQRAMGDHFAELRQKSPLLAEEFGYNAETQRILVHNGEILFHALSFFISSLQTLCTKTIEDTMTTIRFYETARLEYDACRTELDILSTNCSSSLKQQEFEKCKEKYEKYKGDVTVKIQLLDENQMKVMKHQLLLFHNAIAAYFSGNKEALDATMKQFSIQFHSKENSKSQSSSFLESSLN